LSRIDWFSRNGKCVETIIPTRPVALPGALILGLLSLINAACGIVGPSCHEEDGSVLRAEGQVSAGGLVSYSVISPKSSNLLMRLTWTDTATRLGLRATITDCGGHLGCTMDTVTPPFGPGGPSPVPQPWPAGLREMLVDGWKGKTYRVEVTGDPGRDVSFALAVTFQIRCES
jgi:hypothetical protein